MTDLDNLSVEEIDDEMEKRTGKDQLGYARTCVKNVQDAAESLEELLDTAELAFDDHTGSLGDSRYPELVQQAIDDARHDLDTIETMVENTVEADTQ